MPEPFIPEEDWRAATLPSWKLRLLRIVFPFGWYVRIGGKTYVFRDPPPE